MHERPLTGAINGLLVHNVQLHPIGLLLVLFIQNLYWISDSSLYLPKAEYVYPLLIPPYSRLLVGLRRHKSVANSLDIYEYNFTRNIATERN